MNKISTTEGKIRLNWCNYINNFGDELSPYLIKKIDWPPCRVLKLKRKYPIRHWINPKF